MNITLTFIIIYLTLSMFKKKVEYYPSGNVKSYSFKLELDSMKIFCIILAIISLFK